MTPEFSERIKVTVDEDLADLIPGFLENRKKDLAKIEDAVAKNDFETIQAIGHDMKGIGGAYGFDAITDLGAALEKAAKTQEGDMIREHTDAMASYLDNIDIVYE